MVYAAFNLMTSYREHYWGYAGSWETITYVSQQRIIYSHIVSIIVFQYGTLVNDTENIHFCGMDHAA